MRYFFVIFALVCQLSSLVCLLHKEGIKTKRDKILVIISAICQVVALMALIFLWLNK